MTTAVVFAYHDVGYNCLSVLLRHSVNVTLVVTHEDNPAEHIWFRSVAKLAAGHGLDVIAPDDSNVPAVVDRVRALQPDFLFSFYYRNMLTPALLEAPSRGALNMHGSLLPKYRGRVPVNWAVINGERETGATLHYMTVKPDAGDIVAQQAVPILPDETAGEVFEKVAAAAANILDRSLPGLIAGTAPRTPQDLSKGTYCRGRRPEDGRIDWRRSGREIHNLVRGVAPPYPGAFTVIAGRTLHLLSTRIESQAGARTAPRVYVDRGVCFAECADGATLRIIEMTLDGKPFSAADFSTRFGTNSLPLQIEP